MGGVADCGLLVRAGVISPAVALARLQPYDLSTVERSRLDRGAETACLATAVGAGLGVASGAVVFDADRARGARGRASR